MITSFLKVEKLYENKPEFKDENWKHEQFHKFARNLIGTGSINLSCI